MTDKFASKPVQLSTPIVSGEAVDISANDHTASQTSRALWVGTGGDVAVRTGDSTEITFKNVQDGTLLPVRVDVVLRTGTDASDLLLVW
jgi:hypothetical protein